MFALNDVPANIRVIRLMQYKKHSNSTLRGTKLAKKKKENAETRRFYI